MLFICKCVTKILLPSLLVSSLWMTHKRQKNLQSSKDATRVTDDIKIESDENQIVYTNRLREKANSFVPNSNKKSRYGSSSYSQLQVIKDPVYQVSSYDVDYTNEADPYLYPEDVSYLDCNKGST